MRRLWIIFFCFIFLPCSAKEKNLQLQNIFITDTTEVEEYVEPDTTTLKGYAEYIEDSEAIHLKDDQNEFVLNLKVPQKISSKSLIDNYRPGPTLKPNTYSKFGAEEYQIIPKGHNTVISSGGVSFGTTFDQDVDISQLEQTAGIFSSYKKGRFKLNTSYKRTIGSTIGNYTDNVYLTPEIQINKMFTLKQILSANVHTKIKKSELVLSVNPLIYMNNDRLNLELGAGNTYNQDNELVRTRIRFNTKFKL